MVGLKERIALLLAIKEEGKRVPFEHIFEKVSRDVEFLEGRKPGEGEVRAVLDEMVKSGLVGFDGGYYAKEGIDEMVEGIIGLRGKELNLSYSLVWIAKKYYSALSKHMLPFLKGRAITGIKVFSGKKDPISGLNEIYVRYRRYKPKPVYLTVNDEGELMDLVFDHCIDFIPYVHRLGSRWPDYFVLDLDMGSELKKRPGSFELVKVVAKEAYDMLAELGLYPMLKFSGSRGFQVWAILEELEAEDGFGLMREVAVRFRALLEKRLKSLELKEKFPELVKGGEITTSTVAHKEARAWKILVDWSSMKPMGDVRAPFSIHHKTALVSLPLSTDMLEGFRPEDADPLKVLDNASDYVKHARFVKSDPRKLLSFVGLL